MAILVMDTATDTLAVGLWRSDGDMLGATSMRIPRGHSRLLQPTIAALLAGAGLSPSDLTAVGVGVGPGSYTGVRMGVSTAKAMAHALARPLIPLPTLHALAAAAVPYVPREPTRVASFLFARRGRAFGALYETVGTTWRCIQPAVVQDVEVWRAKLHDVSATSPAGAFGWVVVHDFTEAHGLLPVLQDAPIAAQTTLAAVGAGFPRALAALALSGQYEALVGEAVHQLVPNYALEVEAVVQLHERSRERS